MAAHGRPAPPGGCRRQLCPGVACIKAAPATGIAVSSYLVQEDTLRSGGGLSRPELVDTLVVRWTSKSPTTARHARLPAARLVDVEQPSASCLPADCACVPVALSEVADLPLHALSAVR